MSHLRIQLPEIVVPGKRLGRHINHDPQSLRYLVPETSTPGSASWDARIPVLDQGNTGSCTGNATTGELGSEPFFSTLDPSGPPLDEAFALNLYHLATTLDPYDGTFPPDDTGSDGLSAAKAAVQVGDAVGYVHATSIGSAHTLIQHGPFALGLAWRTGCDNPDGRGLISYSGRVRGGHEVCVVAYDSATNTWTIRNSWGPSWGKDGYCYVTDADLVKILADQGDATQLVPITAPAPVPTPPAPGPSAVSLTFLPDEWSALDLFAAYPHHYHQASVAAAAWHKARAGQ